MLQTYEAENYTDLEGHPTGGIVMGVGIDISWQDGPLGRGADRKEPNGAFVETVIDIARQRIKFYNDNGFECLENRLAISYLEAALETLDSRTARREEQGVEGTHTGS